MRTDAPATYQQIIGLEQGPPGFRLFRAEIYNWGTLDKKIWIIPAAGRNILLTGDIGSGKSTVVDALTTLLVPQRQRSYNRAAGSGPNERTERSYILGHWNKEQTAEGVEKAIALRDTSSYSVLLAVFRNERTDKDITLAQVRWINDVGKVMHLYCTAEGQLAIKDHFSVEEGGITELRKQLSRRRDTEIHNSFNDYAGWYRRHLGVTAQAIGLFNQTVSMKAVANLTDFVRQHMLEEPEVDQRIAELLDHFNDLEQAHKAVIEARTKQERLKPIAEGAERRAALDALLDELQAQDKACGHFARHLRISALTKQIADSEHELVQLDANLKQMDDEISRIESDYQQAISDHARQGGDRLESLRRDHKRGEEDHARCLTLYNRYAEQIQMLAWEPPTDFLMFNFQAEQIRDRLAELRRSEEQDSNRQSELQADRKKSVADECRIDEDIADLKRRRSKIDSQHTAIRHRLCEATGIPIEDLPFVGELLQVREEYGEWEGAAERVLRGFAMSLIVPEKYYPLVSDYINNTNLQRKFIYYRVGAIVRNDKQRHHLALANVIDIHPDTPHQDWLKAELSARAPMVRCDTMDEFRATPTAVTIAGQVRSGDRHEKDDSRGINDQAHFVLGWSNEGKIRALEAQRQTIRQQIAALNDQLQALAKAKANRGNSLTALLKIEEYREFAEIDYFTHAKRSQAILTEIEVLEKGSATLQQLAAKIESLKDSLSQVRIQRDGSLKNRGGIDRELTDARANLDRLDRDPSADSQWEQYEASLRGIAAEKGIGHPSSLSAIDAWERTIKGHIGDEIRYANDKLTIINQKLIKGMTQFLDAYPILRQDFDDDLSALRGYINLHTQLRADDLPRLERRFKELLNENAINQIAGFASELRKQRSAIEDRIAVINVSLRTIPYNPGRYIALETQPANHTQVREFQDDLRECTEGSITGSDNEEYSERKFQRVCAIVDRLRGREGSSEADQKWRKLVTDVRNWFQFAASERYEEDDHQHAFYSGTDGKSGGQKEKLAYTVLAASLAYQYGIGSTGDQDRPRCFRFLMIDEAFGRGTDDMARYGMQLFRRLDLQVMVITPLQKILPIEPFVNLVSYMSNPAGNRSTIRNLTIEDFHVECSEAVSVDRSDNDPSAADETLA